MPDENVPYAVELAQQMLGRNPLPESLRDVLLRATELARRAAAPIRSRQIVATIIALWEDRHGPLAP